MKLVKNMIIDHCQHHCYNLPLSSGDDRGDDNTNVTLILMASWIEIMIIITLNATTTSMKWSWSKIWSLITFNITAATYHKVNNHDDTIKDDTGGPNDNEGGNDDHDDSNTMRWWQRKLQTVELEIIFLENYFVQLLPVMIAKGKGAIINIASIGNLHGAHCHFHFTVFWFCIPNSQFTSCHSGNLTTLSVNDWPFDFGT